MVNKISANFFSLMLIITFVSLTGNAAGKMVLYLPFNEGKGEAVSDASDFGNHGEIHDAAWVEGKFREALEFNGTSSYVLVPNSPELNMTTQFTAEAWVNPSQLPLSMIFQKKRIGGGDGEMEYSIMANGVGTAYGDGLSANIQGTNVNFGANLEVGEWQHVAVVYDSGAVTAYIDGEVAGEATAPGEIKIKDGDLVIGLHVVVDKNPDTGGHCRFSGIIDEFIIYNTALSQAEIKKDMAGISTAVSAAGKLSTNWAGIKAQD